jgi:hypothetical protein
VKFLILVTAATLFGKSTAGRVADGTAAPSHIHVAFINCKANPSSGDQLSSIVQDLATNKVTETHYGATRSQPAQQLDLVLAPGFYTVSLVAGKCSESLAVPVVAGVDRDIVAIC